MATILVVDDSAVDRQLAGACVTEEGSEVIYAENAEEALDIIPRENPDVILTDLMMPGMNGLELVEATRRAHRPRPVILMTAYGSEDTALEALKAGATSYVPKKHFKEDLGGALKIVLSAVESRKNREKVRGLLEKSESNFVLGYEERAPVALAMYLENELAELNFCDHTGLFQVNTALSEALSNAVDHGNLELDSAMRERHDGSYYDLGRERMQQTPYCDRRVRVVASLDPHRAKYVIRDEGPGYDTSALPDPLNAENMLKPRGRGIMLIRTFMDEVSFNEKGNEITMIKHSTTPA